MINLLKTLWVLLILVPVINLIGQENEDQTDFNLSAFVDVYYSYDFAQPASDIRQPFLYHHNRHNEFNINLAMIRLAVDNPKYHAVVAMHAGTYAQDNYAAEEDLLKNIFEAYVGVALDKEEKLWLDAGVFSSNLGFANGVSMDNFTLTRSLVAESSPYFLSGAKLTYMPSEKWLFMLLATNGWQRIKRVPGNSLISTGTQIQFKPNDKVLLNWSTFIGTDDPDATRRMRYFNNFYGTFSLSKKWDLIAGFDIGWQQEAKGNSSYDAWLGPVAILHAQWSERWGSALRVEYFHDPSEVAVAIEGPEGFKTTGISLNMDFQPAPSVMCRIEGRYFSSPDEIYYDGTDFSSSNFFFTGSLAVKMGQNW